MGTDAGGAEEARLAGALKALQDDAQAQVFFSCFTLVIGPRRSLSLQLGDTRVYAPQMRAQVRPISPLRCRAGNIVLKTFLFKMVLAKARPAWHVLLVPNSLEAGSGAQGSAGRRAGPGFHCHLTLT